MSNLNRTFCPAVKGAASLDTGVLGPRLNQPRWCLATHPRTPQHVPSSRSARMGFGCKLPVTINSCQLGKACFSNGVGSGSPWGRDGARAAERARVVGKCSGSRGPGEAPTASVSRGRRKASSRGEEAAGVGWFFCPLRAGSQAPWAEARGVTSGQRPGWAAGLRLPAPCPSADLSGSARRVDGPKTPQEEEPQTPSCSHHSVSKRRVWEGPAVSSRAHPCSPPRPPWAPFPPSTGPGTPTPMLTEGVLLGLLGTDALTRRAGGGLPAVAPGSAAAHGVNQRGSRTSSGDSWSGRQGWASTVMRVTKDLRARQLLNWATYCIAKTTPDLPPWPPSEAGAPRAEQQRGGGQPASLTPLQPQEDYLL